MDKAMTVRELIQKFIPFANGFGIDVEINVFDLNISFKAHPCIPDDNKLRLSLSNGASKVFKEILNLKVWEYKFESTAGFKLNIMCGFLENDEFVI